MTDQLLGGLLLMTAGIALALLALYWDEVQKPRSSPWELARYDRLWTSPDGTRYILSGSSGHSTGSGFHHGERTGCPLCRSGLRVDTKDLERRFPDPES